MNRPSPAGLVHSIQARLKNAARETDRPFAELLELFAVERFLHSLGRSEHRERFVLKGALLLRHWLGVHTRPTRDIDLLGSADMNAERLHGLLRELLLVEVEGLSDAFAQSALNTGRWRAFLEKGGLKAVSPDLCETVAGIRRFAQPALNAAREGRSLVEHWPPGGPWR